MESTSFCTFALKWYIKALFQTERQHQRSLLAFVGFAGIGCTHTKKYYEQCGKMKHEITLFHKMGPNRKVLFETHLLSVTTYGHAWSSSVKLLT